MTLDEQLIEAFESGNLGSAQTTLVAGANPDTQIDGYPLLCTAASQANVDAVKLLLQHGATPDLGDAHGRMTPVMFAALSGRDHAPEIIRALHAAGADLNATTPPGVTALDMAVRIGHESTIAAIHRLGGKGSHASQAIAQRLATHDRER
jgi:ankyrin repeat protein